MQKYNSNKGSGKGAKYSKTDKKSTPDEVLLLTAI